MSLASISIVGNVIKPPEQMCFASGRTKTTLVVAVDSGIRPKSADKPYPLSDIYKVEAWGKLGEIAHKYLNKGSMVGATGRLTLSHWQDKQGRDRVTLTVEASQIALPPKSSHRDGDTSTGNFNPVEGEMHFGALDSSILPQDSSLVRQPGAIENDDDEATAKGPAT